MIPNLFSKSKLPDKLPPEMKAIITGLKKISNKEKALKYAYDALTKKLEGCHTLVDIPALFMTDVEKIWRKKYTHCTNLNYLLRILLIKSGLFKEKDIKLKITFVNIIGIHQYLRVRVAKDKYINADPWGKHKKIPFGQYAKGIMF